MITTMDSVIEARKDLNAARLELETLWHDYRHHAGSEADERVFNVMVKLIDCDTELSNAIEAELHKPDDPIATVESITRNGGRAE